MLNVKYLKQFDIADSHTKESCQLIEFDIITFDIKKYFEEIKQKNDDIINSICNYNIYFWGDFNKNILLQFIMENTNFSKDICLIIALMAYDKKYTKKNFYLNYCMKYLKDIVFYKIKNATLESEYAYVNPNEEGNSLLYKYFDQITEITETIKNNAFIAMLDIPRNITNELKCHQIFYNNVHEICEKYTKIISQLLKENGKCFEKENECNMNDEPWVYTIDDGYIRKNIEQSESKVLNDDIGDKNDKDLQSFEKFLNQFCSICDNMFVMTDTVREKHENQNFVQSEETDIMNTFIFIFGIHKNLKKTVLVIIKHHNYNYRIFE